MAGDPTLPRTPCGEPVPRANASRQLILLHRAPNAFDDSQTKSQARSRLPLPSGFAADKPMPNCQFTEWPRNHSLTRILAASLGAAEAATAAKAKAPIEARTEGQAKAKPRPNQRQAKAKPRRPSPRGRQKRQATARGRKTDFPFVVFCVFRVLG